MKKSHFWFALLFAGALSIGVGTSSQNVSAKTVNIYLTRHGQTMFNVNGRGQGWADSPLTDTGVSVAHQLGYGLYGLKFKAAYSADNMRTFRTATYALQSSGNGNLKVNWNSNLREGGYGSFEGQKYDDVNKVTMPLLRPAGTYSGPQDFSKAQQALGKDFWPALQDAYHAAETVDFGKYSDPSLPESLKAESSTQVIDRMNTELTLIAQKAEKTGGNVLVVSSGMSIPEWLSSEKNYTVPGFVNWGNEATMKVTYKNGQFYFPSNVTDKTILYTINKGAELQQLPKNTLKVNRFYLKKNKVSGTTSTGASLTLKNPKGSTLKNTNANSNGNFTFKLSKATLNKLKKGMNLKLTSTPKNAAKSLDMNSDQISQTVFGNKTTTVKVLK
ncbi:2,3-bisphosphoglycerate-dependent phosphoglycerate mutase [Lentilactobacillus sunkii]|jgi:broad specificity phosphatase PhoE|uniref:2,3-bisphosphoglycerate-dependent phosphoglycerate mutase n=1 Tax=Lentilactobacillus sunkii TaxID=481719 RepID=A0A1E7XGA7_9LACO|nr:histidine phosphatase family protein [Lentilactobacillus sunkii]OFA12089.1 2,3-bisphosphoglycerate-dependent phosphoglycerate mutase [Lentilactobacillus sunkii]